jgi:hypothetical protein
MKQAVEQQGSCRAGSKLDTREQTVSGEEAGLNEVIYLESCESLAKV